jgi:hypothetical protein
MSERIYKLQPNRTMSLRGFDALGASAAIHSATANSFQVSGNFRDTADFAVLVLYDADNFYEHPRLKYLPDFNFSGLILTFNVQYDSGLQPLDSPKYNWIDWATLDCSLLNGTSAKVTLWDHCSLASGNFTAASGTFHLTSSSTLQPYDRVTLWFQNFAYDFVVPPQVPSVEYQFFDGGTTTNPTITINGRSYQSTTDPSTQTSSQQAEALVALINAGTGDPQVTAAIGSVPYSVLLSAIPGSASAGVPVTATGNANATLLTTTMSDVATALATEINSSNWWLVAPTHALRAVASSASIAITAARYGTVNTAGTSVAWVSGAKFTGLVSGETITINNAIYTIASVTSSLSLTLMTSAGSQTAAQYVADRGGVDGNMIQLYSTNKTSTLACLEATLPLSGGNSNVTWQCSLDFTALGIDQLRQCWFTYAPALANGIAYPGSEWQATYTNWTVTGGPAPTYLQVAGPNSVRVEDSSTACVYTGAWATQAPETGFFSEGIARRAGSPGSITGETVTVTYSCGLTHDLYLGTSLYTDRGNFGIRLDGDPQTQLNCYLDVDTQVNTRRLVRSGVAPGTHKVELIVLTEGYVYFDFIEAAVPSDVPAAPTARSNISPALDYSTGHSYKLPPARIMWIMDMLGLTAPVNQYIGILWYNQRNNPGVQFPSLTVTFNGAWNEGDEATLTISSVPLTKSIVAQDTNATIAAHFAYWINEGFVGIWASASANVLTITARSPAYNTFAVVQSVTRASGIVPASNGSVALSDPTGSLGTGNLGTWMVDPTQSPAMNRGARDWHSDLYFECKNRSREIVTSGSMELINPPAGFAALFPDGTAVLTAEGFDNLLSTQCAPSSLPRTYQESVFDCITDLQNAAGLTPNVQFGEYLWWYFTNYSATSNPRGGMAYYDAETSAAAVASLGRPLHTFVDPNDDPTINNGADATFLRNRLRDHVAALSAHVKSRYPSAQCEVLFPYDVNYPTPQDGVGGRLNNFINFPVEWGANTTAGYDRLKIEALAFGGSMRDLDLALIAITYPFTLSWPLASLRYLVPVFVQCGAWQKELAMALGMRYPVVNLWAFDQVNIFGLDILAAANQARSTSFGLT